MSLSLVLSTSALAGPDLSNQPGVDETLPAPEEVLDPTVPNKAGSQELPSSSEALKPSVPNGLNRNDPRVADALRNTPWAAGPSAEAFQQALLLEEVARKPEEAIAKYQALVNDYRKQGSGQDGIAAIALFRIAEIRRKQGSEKEALKLYGQVAAEFSAWEPMAGLSRKQLGLDPSDFLPQFVNIEDDVPLTNDIERSLWKIRSRKSGDKFVLVTFEVKPDAEKPADGIPGASKTQTLYYLPGAPLTGTLSTTCLKGETLKITKKLNQNIRKSLGIRINGFGHSFDVPSGLCQTALVSVVDTKPIGKIDLNPEVRVLFTFDDELGKEDKKLSVDILVHSIPESKARALAASRSLNLLEMTDKTWSLTLPPLPGEITKDFLRE